MYSLIRVWIGLKLARIEIHDRVVVSTTSRTASPSAPTLYWIPKNGIQSTVSLYWNPRSIGQVADEQQERHDPGQQGEDQARSAAPPTPRTKPTTSAPTRGRKMTIVSSGMLETSMSAARQDQV